MTYEEQIEHVLKHINHNFNAWEQKIYGQYSECKMVGRVVKTTTPRGVMI